VDFIDIDILKRFPNLNGLVIWDCNIPVLKNIFTVDLKMIQYLGLSWNKIKILEAHVFNELVELKWIDLGGNKIEEILHPIFAKNKKLEFADLSCNKIRTLHPFIFDGLPRLVQVNFDGNPKINSQSQRYHGLSLGSENFFLHSLLKKSLKFQQEKNSIL
jgi:hypothetical protein